MTRRLLARLRDDYDSILRAHPLLSVGAVTAAVVFGLCAVWVFVTPIGATNDEGSQIIKAVSVPRGQILGAPLTPEFRRTIHGAQRQMLRNCVGELRNRGANRQSATNRCSAPFSVVNVPESFTTLSPPQSCNGFALIADSCPNHLNGSDRSVEAMTYVGHYPPLYYAIVGLPSLVTQTDTAIYGMRLVSSLLTSLLLGLAVGLVATWSKKRILLLAVVTAATPIVFVFGAAVNPSSLEMASALCAWTGLVTLVLEHADRPPLSLVVASTTASAVLVLCRPLSPLWLVIMVMFVVVLRPSAIRRLAGDHRVRIGMIVLAGATVIAAAYDLWARPFSVLPVGGAVPPGASLTTLSQVAFGNLSGWMYQLAGGFGWALSNPPLLGCALLGFALCAVVLSALVTSGRRQMLVFATLTATAILVPVAIVMSQAEKNGIVWQARDGYPLYCGVLVVAGAIARSPAPKGPPTVATQALGRGVVLVATCVALAQLADVFWALRRYTVGLAGTLNLWTSTPGPFSPPVSNKLLLLAMLAFSATYGWWIVQVAGRMPSRMLVHHSLAPASQTPPEPHWTRS